MQIIKNIIFIGMLFFSLIAHAEIYTENKTAIIVTADHPDFIIKLKSNPTTGYSWFLREYNSNLVIPISHKFEKSNNKNLIGAPGYEIWTFQAKASGFKVPQQTLLHFIYMRPWESKASGTELVFSVIFS